jgi:hypothetical protein
VLAKALESGAATGIDEFVVVHGSIIPETGQERPS